MILFARGRGHRQKVSMFLIFIIKGLGVGEWTLSYTCNANNYSLDLQVLKWQDTTKQVQVTNAGTTYQMTVTAFSLKKVTLQSSDPPGLMLTLDVSKSNQLSGQISDNAKCPGGTAFSSVMKSGK
jgi:hypothetical protein